MNKDVLGVVNLGEKEEYIQQLTEVRPLAAIPFAGRYRIIDFILSNMVNSKIEDIAIVQKDKFHSINDHIGPGKHWDLDRKTGGLRLLYPDINYDDFTMTVGDLSILSANSEYFAHNKKSHVLYTRSNYIGNIDFSDAIKDHVASGRDITFLTQRIQNSTTHTEYLGMDTLVQQENGNYSIGKFVGNLDEYDLSVEMYLIKKDVFLKIITDAVEQGIFSYFKQALISGITAYEVGSFEVSEQITPIISTQSYFNASMRLLDPEYLRYLFFKNGNIVTKSKDAPPAIYRSSSNVMNSLVANGCIIEGTVENSILFRNVKIGRGSVVRNSIVFQGAEIGRNCTVNYCILDKDVVVGNSKLLVGDGGFPYVLRKGVSI